MQARGLGEKVQERLWANYETVRTQGARDYYRGNHTVSIPTTSGWEVLLHHCSCIPCLASVQAQTWLV